jgi:hypothetical protein
MGMSYHRSHRLFFWQLLARQERCRAIIPYQFIRNFLLGLTPPLPSSLLATHAFFNPSYPISNPSPPFNIMSSPPPPDLYQSRQAYWGTRTPLPIATTTATTTATTCHPPPLIGKRSTCSVWCYHLPLRRVFPPQFCSAIEQTCGGCSIHFCH